MDGISGYNYFTAELQIIYIRFEVGESIIFLITGHSYKCLSWEEKIK